MRCLCCNRNLSDYESTLKRVDTGLFVDICLKCLEDIPIATVGRSDLEKTSQEPDDFELDFFEDNDE